MAAATGLVGLSADVGTLSPGFSPGRRAYALNVPHHVASLRWSALPADPAARVQVSGAAAAAGQPSAPVELAVGRNRVVVTVTDTGGATAYEVVVVRRHPTPDWLPVDTVAPFAARDSAGELVFRDRMWLFGGYTPGLVNDVWSTADGRSWQPEAPIPTTAGINIPLAWAYDDRMWVASNDGQLFRSADGAQWSLVCANPPWAGRYAAGAAVFRGRMWALGGMGQGRLWCDLWSSTDGQTWTCESASAPWSGRQLFSMVVVHDDQLWVLVGGIPTYHPFRAYTDIWCSPDGQRWTEVTEAAPWPARIWSSATVYRERLWVFSGFRSEPTWNNFDDVWYSADGQCWHRLVTDRVWSARHEVSPYVHRDRLWVVGGNAWPLQRDSWYLDLSAGLSFLTQPVIEEFSGARYGYQARADFGVPRSRVGYRLLAAPDWLAVNTDTGAVSGTAGSPGDYPVTLEAFDEVGGATRQDWVLHVLAVG